MTNEAKILKRAFSLVALLMLSGCAMKNDEIIAECGKCQKAGMECREIMNIWTYSTEKIVCSVPDVCKAKESICPK